ncbi:hypothetical protein [Haloarcula montana]|uniref:hypothetical protein n=1 Tax=Haloarcula montana TaxID=3111776 RepID=UPI002D79C0BC|nr:hypothetical protein [Haloarcula sp. GH36]
MHRSDGDTTTHHAVESDRGEAETLVARNYDHTERRKITVGFTDSDGDGVIERTLAVGPLETVSIRTSLERGEYQIEAETERGASDRAVCVIGEHANECGLIEIGNGIISISDGYW